MPKKISEAELRTLVQVVVGFPAGASLQQIAGNAEYSSRTLQRRLTLLVKDGLLAVSGKGRWCRYRVPEKTQKSRLGEEAVDIPLSPGSEETRNIVRQPMMRRHPVGYNRAFLDAYRPNETRYLSVAERIKLDELGGGSPREKLPAGTYVREILNRLLIDLSWNSSRLEGNTYSLLETERLLVMGESVEGKDARDAQMILNHKNAIEMLVEQAAEIGFNRYTICNLHALLSENLLADPSAVGRLRSKAVGITGTVFRPLEGPQLIEECFQQILDTSAAIADPFEQAFFVMVHLPYLQPFEDVNKRVSRLAANISLIHTNLCPLSFVDVPERAYIDGILGVYELNRLDLLREVFIWAYERSCARYSAVRQSLGNPDPFRMKYRQAIMQTVGEVVLGRMAKQPAANHIQECAKRHAKPLDQKRFVEVAETELMNLHEGNISRYRLRPSDFFVWRETWS